MDDLEFELDLRGGPMAPGFSDEGDGSSEIEFSVSFPAGSNSRVPIQGSGGPDWIVLGDLAPGRGANLNPAEDVDDRDVTIRGAYPLVNGRRGADIVSARGGDGFIGPYPGSMVALGERGDDVLTGSPNNDYLIGGRGHDTLKGGRGGDFLHAADDARDIVRCGRDPDLAKVDRIDRLHGCEEVRTKRPSSG